MRKGFVGSEAKANRERRVGLSTKVTSEESGSQSVRKLAGERKML
jgi:hypothetical protein